MQDKILGIILKCPSWLFATLATIGVLFFIWVLVEYPIVIMGVLVLLVWIAIESAFREFRKN